MLEAQSLILIYAFIIFHKELKRTKLKIEYPSIGVHRQATKKEIKSAYIRQSKLCNPDRNRHNTAAAAVQFNEIRYGQFYAFPQTPPPPPLFLSINFYFTRKNKYLYLLRGTIIERG